MFDCAECGRHIIRFAGGVREPPLCAMCICIPNWFADPALRKLLDPEHDGREAMDRKR